MADNITAGPSSISDSSISDSLISDSLINEDELPAEYTAFDEWLDEVDECFTNSRIQRVEIACRNDDDLIDTMYQLMLEAFHAGYQEGRKCHSETD